ncbi:VanZ family protein [Maritimibacter sp. DP1N21-5]|uniref:VanZ family protein n=1 Tax=Maritimibacter sp. DP1N21-5 TaxID=2836867 RepID=UPI001C459C6F|nr:VanZ family protein [Maritimibacter sp. DP1N21-5]MBV7410696.1 VanZ family protein [Maritimibacter sp. DP1N21-5]
MPEKKAHLIALGGSFLSAVMILWLTLTPQAVSEIKDLPLDKLAHVAAFAIYVLPTAALFPRALLPVVLLGVTLGGGIEVIQPWFGRAQELADFGADLVGLALGCAVGLGVRAFLRQVPRKV